MLDEKDLDLLEAYTYGDLDAAAEQSLQARIGDDPDFATEVREWELLEQAGLVVNMVSDPSIRDEVLAAVSGVENGEPTSTSEAADPGSSFNLWWLLVAAALIGALIFGYSQNLFSAEPEPESESVYADLVKEHFKHLPSELLTLGAAETLQERAISLYEDRKYAEALPLLLEVVEQGGDSLNLLYAGVAAVGVGDGEMAKEILSELAISNLSQDYLNETEYYQYWANLLTQDELIIQQPDLIQRLDSLYSIIKK